MATKKTKRKTAPQAKRKAAAPSSTKAGYFTSG